MPCDFRLFEAKDHAPALALWQSTSGVGLSAADELPAVSAFLARNPGLSYVAMRGQALVGTVLCGHDGRRGLVHHLVVATGERRQGIASKLLSLATSALAAQGIQKAHLMVFRANFEGQAFWQAVGAIERTDLALYSVATKSAA